MQRSKKILANIDLFLALIKREIASKTSSTLLGWFWLFLQPSLQIIAIWFLFGFILKIRYPDVSGGFIGHYLTGIIPWLMMSEILQRSLSVYIDYSNIYQKNIFPLWILPLVPAAVTICVYLTIYIVAIALIYGPGSIIFSALAILICFSVLIPLLYIFSVVSVFLRDFQQIVPFVLTMTFYLTPILYRSSEFPKEFSWWLKINPFAIIIELTRDLVVGHSVGLNSLIFLFLFFSFFFYVAVKIFRRASIHIREAL